MSDASKILKDCRDGEIALLQPINPFIMYLLLRFMVGSRIYLLFLSLEEKNDS